MDGIETGVDFNFTYAPGITEEQILGVELAGEMWSNYLGDTHQYVDQNDVSHLANTTINIHIEIGSDLLADDVIGGAFPAIISKNKYDNISSALIRDASTYNDLIATDSLLGSDKANVAVNGEVIENDKFQLTRANLKALDLIDSDSILGQELDGYILMSDLSDFDTVEWNYDYLGGAKPDTLDFLTTIAHEIGHTLGFISGTDRVGLTSETLGYYQSIATVDVIEQALSIKDRDRDKFNSALDKLQNIDNSVDATTAHDALKAIEKYLKYDKTWKEFIKEDQLFKEAKKEAKDNLDTKKLANKMTSLDLFRYSHLSYNLGANQLTRGVSSYFSLDGLQTGLAMSNGQDYQGSHWQDRDKAEGLGIMNPTVALNERWEISENDLMAMDAIGWDVDYAQPLDLPTLYSKASAAVDSAWIGDRTNDVAEILKGDAYDARRSRASRGSTSTLSSTGGRTINLYSMTVDGYFSTFSESDLTETETFLDHLTISPERNWQASSSNISQIVETANLALTSQEKSIAQVDVDYLEMKNPDLDRSWLKEILGSLNTGLEIAIATKTL